MAKKHLTISEFEFMIPQMRQTSKVNLNTLVKFLRNFCNTKRSGNHLLIRPKNQNKVAIFCTFNINDGLVEIRKAYSDHTYRLNVKNNKEFLQKIVKHELLKTVICQN